MLFTKSVFNSCSLQGPVGTVISETQQANWYQQLFGSYEQLSRLYSAEEAVSTTAGDSMTACDSYGHCATASNSATHVVTTSVVPEVVTTSVVQRGKEPDEPPERRRLRYSDFPELNGLAREDAFET